MKNPYSLHTPEKIETALADRARELRLAKGWRQKTLAERSGVSLASLRRFEANGKISLQNLLKIAFALGRLDDFVSVLDPPPARSIDELAAVQEVPRRQRGRL